VDGPVEPSSGGPYDPSLEPRLSRVENDVRDIKDVLVELKVTVARMEAKLDATLPHLATKADIADKPSKSYMWGILAALLTAYACGLAALAILK
jgi:uncharacterized coiled-coil protein SlyX